MGEIVDEMLAAGGAAPALAQLLKSQHRNGNGRGESSLLPVQELRRAVLASMVNAVAHHLPADAEKLADLMGDGHDEVAARLLPEGVHMAELAIQDYLERALKNARELASMIQARKESK
jgi:NAD-specific glutamate dehydrogenase